MPAMRHTTKSEAAAGDVPSFKRAPSTAIFQKGALADGRKNLAQIIALSGDTSSGLQVLRSNRREAWQHTRQRSSGSSAPDESQTLRNLGPYRSTGCDALLIVNRCRRGPGTSGPAQSAAGNSKSKLRWPSATWCSIDKSGKRAHHKRGRDTEGG